MKRVLLIILISFLFMGFSCEKNDQVSTSCLKGKLVLKGICMNYVIELVDGNIDTSLIEKLWVNPMTKAEYQNVFGLASICTFPENIAEGQEFYFTVLKLVEPSTCMQCKAYAPTPDKKLHISICSVN